MQDTVMKISDFIRTETIFLGKALADKNSILRFIAEKCRECMIVHDDKRLYEGLRSREESMSTGIGDGLAFPHTTTPDSASSARAALMRPSSSARPVSGQVNRIGSGYNRLSRTAGQPHRNIVDDMRAPRGVSLQSESD